MKKIVVGTLIVEAAGAALYMATFVPQFGAAGIWKSVFNAVSAFCNAGMDILGPDSLMQYRDNWNVNLVTMALTILGGLGFPIWFILIDRIKDIRAKRISRKRAFRGLPIYAKAVLLMTVVLLFGGAILVFILEYNNEATLSNLPLHEKILAAMFQSMTLRTAGFCTISQAGLTRGTMLISCVLMFIGGSPAGTAGGIKTTTVLILLSSLFSSLSDRNETHFARRRISAKNVRRAMTVFMTSFAVMLAALIVFCAVQPGTFEDCLYEVASAIGTVGLSRDFTATLNAAGKLIIIATMYLGRIGPISLALFFNTKKYVNLIEYPEENLPVG